MIDYDPHRWHDHLLDIKGSMVRQITSRVLTCVVWAGAITYVHHEVVPISSSNQAHVLIGVVLGLLLVFRTNASYDRFWEGRKLWGSIINESRNLGRAGAVFLADAPDLLRPLLLWAMAFPHATMLQLRGGKGLGRSIEWLPPEDAVACGKEVHVPLGVARRMTALLAEARRRGLVTDIMLAELDRNVFLLVDYLGACERIYKTPLPFAYVVHLRRIIILYCFTLPFALVETYGWGTVIVTLFLAYALFGIEEIGVQIEDPFGFDDNDLPLERFCNMIEKELRSLLPPAEPTPTPPAPMS